MAQMERLSAMADIEAAHFAFDAARVELAATADATPLCNLLEQGIAPACQALRADQ
jgi:hypothetical protein